MRKIWYIITMLLLVITLMLFNTEEVYAKKKIIDIVYDNSGSMAFEPGGIHDGSKYITRWVEADYAIRAFAACKEDSDILYLFPMSNNTEKKVEKFKIDNDKSAEIDKASTNFISSTPYRCVINAINHLKKCSDVEKWLIILTDGVFNDKSYEEKLNKYNLTYKEKDDSAVDKNLSIILEKDLENTGINVLYLPIGNKAKRISTNNKRITQITGEGKVLQQILEINKKIYNRNILAESKPSQEMLEFTIDAPLKELIVFMQTEGEESYFGKNIKKKAKSSLKNKMSKFSDDLQKEVFNIKIQNDDRNINSYSKEKKPTYSSEASTADRDRRAFEKYLKTKEISGEMCILSGKSNNVGKRSESILLSEKESVSLYYQLDLGIEMEVRQDGHIVQTDKLREGKYQVTVYPINPNTGERISETADLLNSLSVKLNNKDCKFGESVTMDAIYGQDIELIAKVEGMGLKEPITSPKKEYGIIENIYPIDIEVTYKSSEFYYNKMNESSIKDGEASYITVKFMENSPNGKIPLRDTTIDKLELDCSVSHSNQIEKQEPDIIVTMKPSEETEDEYFIYPYLAQEDDNNAYNEVSITIKACRSDEPELSETLVSEPIELIDNSDFQAEIVSSKEYNLCDLIRGRAKVILKCDGKEIPDEEWKKVEFEMEIGDSSKDVFSRKLNFDVLHWFFYPKDSIQVHKKVTYSGRGEYMAILQGVIKYSPIPLWMRMVVIAIVIFIIMLFIVAVINHITKRCFGIRFRALLCLTESGLRQGYLVKPKKIIIQTVLTNRRIIFRLADEECGIEKSDIPDMFIKKAGKKSEGFYILNNDYYANDSFKIDGLKISNETVVRTEQCIKIIDSKGLHYELRFGKKGDLEEI